MGTKAICIDKIYEENNTNNGNSIFVKFNGFSGIIGLLEINHYFLMLTKYMMTDILRGQTINWFIFVKKELNGDRTAWPTGSHDNIENVYFFFCN